MEICKKQITRQDGKLELINIYMRYGMTTRRNEHGFTLIEAMIAVAVLMLGVLVLEKNIIAQVFYNNSTKLASTATSGASSLVERLQALSFNNAWLSDVDHAGLNSLDGLWTRTAYSLPITRPILMPMGRLSETRQATR